MILGVTLLKKKYPLVKYLCVLLIVGGVALFLYKPNKSSAVVDDHVFGFGEILLVSSASYSSSNKILFNNIWLFISWPRFAAGLADFGRLDGRVPGPHEGSLSNHRKLHDAEYQPVVHAGAGTRWARRVCCQTAEMW